MNRKSEEVEGATSVEPVPAPKRRGRPPGRKPKSMDELIAQAVERALQTALPMAVGALARVQETVAAKSRSVADQQFAMARDSTTGAVALETCQECGQFKKACKSKHVQMVVFPKSMHNAKGFTGLYLNGKRYCSNSPGHYITVPEDNSFTHDIAVFEENEEIARNGWQSAHFSGTVRPGDMTGFRSSVPGVQSGSGYAHRYN